MINTFIIAAMTADGFIAKDNGHSPMAWTSKDDKKRFVEVTKRAGVVVMGLNTFLTLPNPLKDRVNIVYSPIQEIRDTDGHLVQGERLKNVEVTQDNPASLIEKLDSRGFKEVAICGGSQIYTLFLKARVVDRIYLTIEPVIFGHGVSLFKEAVDCRLELISSHTTPQGSFLLEYKVNYV